MRVAPMLADITLVVFPALMAFAAMSDLVTMTISNRVSVLLVCIFAVLAVCLGFSPMTLAWHVGVALAVLVVVFGMFSLGWIGGGDAKLAAATTLWVGPTLLIEYFFWASLFGGALTLAIIFARGTPLPAFALGWGWANRLHDSKSGIPYGIALASAGLVVYPATEIWQKAFGG
jgi:prepilin peptidase CpaA